MVSYKRLRWRLDGPGEDARRCPNCEPGGYPAARSGVVRRRSGPGASVTISPIHRRDDNDAPAIGAPDPRATKARALHKILSAFTKEVPPRPRALVRGRPLHKGGVPHIMAASVRNAKVIQRFALRMAAGLAQEAGR